MGIVAGNVIVQAFTQKAYEIGLRVRDRRLEKELTQADLATLADVRSRHFIANLEKGKTFVYDVAINKIATALDIPVNYLLNGEEIYGSDEPFTLPDDNTFTVVKYGYAWDKMITRRIETAKAFMGIDTKELVEKHNVKLDTVNMYIYNNKGRRTIADVKTICTWLKLDIETAITGRYFEKICGDKHDIHDKLMGLKTKFGISLKDIAKLCDIPNQRLTAICALSQTARITYYEVKKISKTFGFSNSNALIANRDFVEKATHPSLTVQLSKDERLEIGNRIREARWFYNMGTNKLAAMIGISEQKLINIENGKTSCSSVLALKITEALGLNPDHLLHGVHPPYEVIDTRKKIGCYIRLMKHRKGLSNIELAHKCGWESIELLTKVENGDITVMNKTFLRVCKGLDIEPDSFITYPLKDQDELTETGKPCFLDGDMISIYNSYEQRVAIGNRIREAREAKHLTQLELACKLGCCKSSVGNIERGQKRETRISLSKLAKTLDVTVEWLMNGVTSKDIPIEEKEIAPFMPSEANHLDTTEVDDEACGSTQLHKLINNELKEFSEIDLIKVLNRISEIKRLNELDKLLKDANTI